MAMGRNLDDIIDRLPKARQKKIEALSVKKIEDMIAHAETLTDFRKAVGKTQVQVAKQLGIKQHAVSQLEKRSDTYVSTLRRFLKTLDLNLELSVVAKNGNRINLPNFLPWRENDTVTADAAALVPTTKTRARKPASRGDGDSKSTASQKKTPEVANRGGAISSKTTSVSRSA
jgi:transcriptional regulator with XRE-family HTH domain